MWTIAKLSFKEILYKKIFLIALLMTLAYLLLYGVATHFAAAAYLEDMERMAEAGKECWPCKDMFMAPSFYRPVSFSPTSSSAYWLCWLRSEASRE